jgi:hypothetical protein
VKTSQEMLATLLKNNGFYETATIYMLEFSATPPGVLDPVRLAEGKASHWKGLRPVAGESSERKKVLITDFSWRYKINKDALAFYNSLLVEGFELFLWLGRPVRYTGMPSLQYALRQVEPCEHAPSKFKILDYYETGRLIGSGIETCMATLDIADFMEEGEELSRVVSRILPLIKIKKPQALKALTKEQYEDSVLGRFIRTLLPSLQGLCPGHTLDDANIVRLIKQTPLLIHLELPIKPHISISAIPPTLKTLTLKECIEFSILFSYPAEFWGTLETISFIHSVFSPEEWVITLSELETLFKMAPALVSLEVSGCVLSGNFSSEFLSAAPPCTALKNICLNRADISLVAFEEILQIAPQLEKLTLAGSIKGAFSQEFIDSNFRCKAVVVMSLMFREKLTLPVLEVMLSTLPNLENLLLYCSENVDGQFSHDFLAAKIKLEALHTLTLEGTTVSLELLESLYEMAPRLQIHTCDLASDSPSSLLIPGSVYKPKVLAAVRSLAVWADSSTKAYYENMLTEMQNLEILDIRLCRNFNLRPHSLRQLTHLKISGKYTADQLVTVLGSTPQLESIVTCDLPNGVIPSLAQAKIILKKLKKSDICLRSLTDIAQFASVVPNLEAIKYSLVRVEEMPGRVEVKEIYTELKKLVLSRTRCSPEEKDIGVDEILFFNKIAPNLEELSLECFVQITGDMHKLRCSGTVLSKLKTLKLSMGSIMQQQLETFLRLAPNIEKLQLQYVLIRGDFSQCQGFQYSVRDLDLSCSQLSHAQLQQLLALFPKVEIVRLRDVYFKGVFTPKILQSLAGLQKIEYTGDRMFLRYALREQITEALTSESCSVVSTTASLSINTDTEWRQQTFRVIQYFKGPLGNDPSHYRLEVLSSPGESSDTCEPVSVSEMTVTAINSAHSHLIGSHLGCYTGTFSGFETLLPSLTFNDRIIGIASSVPLLVIPKRNQQRYAVVTADGEVYPTQTVYFLLAPEPANQNHLLESEFYPALQLERLEFDGQGALIPNETAQLLRSLTPLQQIKALRDYFLGFGPGKLDIPAGASYYQIRNAMIKQLKGACGTRSELFFDIAKALGLNVNYVSNQCHAFIEAIDGKHMFQVDLGGYPADIEIEDIFARCPSEQVVNTEAPRITTSLEPLRDQNPSVTQSAARALEMPTRRYTLPRTVTTPSRYYHWLREQAARLPQTSTSLLVLYDTEEQADELLTQFYAQSQGKHACFYLDTLDDVNEQTLIADENGCYDLVDSPLVTFLKTCRSGDFFIINSPSFKAEHAGYTSLQAAQRSLLGYPIPHGVAVVMLIPQTNVYDYGVDFYTGFPFITVLPTFNRVLPCTEPTVMPERVPLQLYASDTWRSQCLGQYHLGGTAITFSPLGLTAATPEHAWHFEFVNPPRDREFEVFYQQLVHARRFTINGTVYPVPEKAHFTVTQRPYEEGKEQLRLKAIDTSCPPEWQTVLNPLNRYQFFKNYHLCGQHLVEAPGLLDLFAHQTLRVLLTQDLREGEWAELLTHARKVDCTLELIVPQEFPECDLGSEWLSQGHRVIHTEDAQATARACWAQNQDSIVICIDDYTQSSQLLGYPRPIMPKALACTWQTGALAKRLLLDKKPVILQGTCSLALETELSSLFSATPCLWINGERHLIDIPVTIVTENKSAFSQVTRCYRDSHSTKPQCRALPVGATEPDLGSDSLSPEDYDRERVLPICTILQTEPSVFLMGPTGSGKSTLVFDDLFKQPGVIPFSDLDHLGAWARCQQSGFKKRLFIDEANNLTSAELTGLLGLYAATPGLLVDTDWCPLSKDHEIIFAGNPFNYDGRLMHPLWQRHVVMHWVAPLPLIYIKKRILVSLGQSLQFKPEPLEQVSQACLARYHALIQAGVIVTPRNIQHWLLCVAAALSTGNLTAEEIPEFVDAMFEASPSRHLPPIPLNGCVLTNNRIPVLQAMQHILAIRALKQHQGGLSKQGINFCLLEGEVKCGKITLVKALLEALGYTEVPNPNVVALKTTVPAVGNIYYVLNAAKPDSLSALLPVVFHQGAVVIIKKINTLPHYLERLLNTLLSGTDMQGLPPQNPGFTLFGLQYPAGQSEHIYHGLKKFSAAFLNRSLLLQVPNYSIPELINILHQRGKSQACAERLVQAYVLARQTSQAIDYACQPTPLNLFDWADHYDETQDLANSLGKESPDADRVGVRLIEQEPGVNTLLKYLGDGRKGNAGSPPSNLIPTAQSLKRILNVEDLAALSHDQLIQILDRLDEAGCVIHAKPQLYVASNSSSLLFFMPYLRTSIKQMQVNLIQELYVEVLEILKAGNALSEELSFKVELSKLFSLDKNTNRCCLLSFFDNGSLHNRNKAFTLCGI